MIISCPACSSLNRVPPDKDPASGKCGRCGSPLFSRKPIDLTGETFDAHASRSDLPLVVDFWASWCGPCRQMAPAFAKAATELEPTARLAKVDTEREQAIAARFAIRSIPTMAIFSKGREMARTSGAMPAHAIVDWVRRAIG